MIIDDKAAMLRLTAYPEFALRHDEFVSSYGRSGLPGLTVQLRPVEQGTVLNLDDSALLARLSTGAPSQNAYWASFRPGTKPRPTMHGVSSLPTWKDPQWAFEAHRDGHFIAGVWEFPSIDGTGDTGSRALPAFFGKMFEDFFAVAAAIVSPINPTLAFNATVTISGTDVLNFAAKSDFGDQWVKGSGPVERRLIQLPVYQTQLGAPSWHSAAADLARAMCGAYGFSYRV